MLKIYDYLFYRQYKSIASVNKISPKFSAIIYFSLLIFINVMSILLLFKNSIETIGLNAIYALLTLILVFNFWRYNKKYKTIIAEFDEINRHRVWNYLVFFYPYISFFILFKILEFEYSMIVTTIVILFIIDAIAYMYSEEENLKNN